jgi:cyclic beta-1,2-glucan synthetase
MPSGQHAAGLESLPLEESARTLAAGHRTTRNGGRPVHLKRLDRLASLFTRAYGHFSLMAEAKHELPLAAEWLLDNYYIIHQTVREVRNDLPPKFYRQLPALADAPTAPPRIYALARALTARLPLHHDPEIVRRFTAAYQETTPLTIGELWALPAMLRLATLERLGRATTALLESVRQGGPSTPEESYIGKSALPSDDEGECLVSDGVLDLRAIDAEDWKKNFESLSLVERILRRDPADLYARMDFETRDAYRKAVEEIAERTAESETAVAETAIALSEEESLRREAGMAPPARRRPRSHLLSIKARNHPADTSEGPSPQDSGLDRGDSFHTERSAHVGFYLIERGRDLLEQRLEFKPSAVRRVRHWIAERVLRVYLGSILALSAALCGGIAMTASLLGGDPWQIALAGICGLIPSLTMAVGLVHAAVPRFVRPHLLPRMDFQEGIPNECRTLVVVPAMLEGAEEIRTLLRRLEQHYLNTLDENLYFALLTDHMDAPQEKMPGDEALVAQACEGILALNRKYGAGTRTPFHLLHRAREWNEREGVWMGWERKRGKLVELMHMLSGEKSSAHRLILFDEVLPPIRYVITLDADSSLTRGGARRLIATLAHPLNQAQFDSRTGELASGYTVLQPRVRIFPTNVTRTLFARLFAGDPGLDLYTQAVSDVYQDLFQEGIYVGKGIFDVSAFHRCIAGRIPENALLSHDLFEGLLGRAGLVTNVVLLENFPGHYLAYAERMHRWIRGDWQLLPWLLLRVPAEGGRRIPNYLSAFDRWKVFDNIRRSLLAPSMLAFLLAGWLALPPPALLWTVLALLPPGVLLLAGAALNVRLRWPAISPLESLRPLWMDLARWGFSILLLPFESLLVLNATGVTLFRMAVTRRRLLEWTPAENIARAFRRGTSWTVVLRRMASGPAAAVAAGALLVFIRPDSLPSAVLPLAAWLLSPLAVQWISSTTDRRPPPLSAGERQRLRNLAGRTWRFYETFVGPEDNWLPPDHFQESPRGLVAHRTSPTNIGLLLLADLAACDLGYIGTLGMILRLSSTLETLRKMERYRGHFLNWYDTRTLAPLPPAYVSTVDSGNLAACLITLSQACQSMSAQPVLRAERWEGVADLVSILIEELEPVEETPARKDLRRAMDALIRRLRSAACGSDDWAEHIRGIEENELSKAEQCLLRLIDEQPATLSADILEKIRIASARLHYYLMNMQRDESLLLPWKDLLHKPPEFFASADCPPPVLAEWRLLAGALPANPRLSDFPAAFQTAEAQLEKLRRTLEELPAATAADAPARKARDWSGRLGEKLRTSRRALEDLQAGLRVVSAQCEALIAEIDFRFLFDSRRQVFHIGYNLEAGKLDDNHYDLLASEARLASLVAIAKGDAPTAHWLHLGRPLVRINGSLALLSWSGTMFEFLMPNLLARSYPGTLLDQTCRAAVRRQIQYARGLGLPWGISESGFFAFDAAQNYQYRAFGVPGLGFKRGLENDRVIAPYASILALALAPRETLGNLSRMERSGLTGRYGLYEALDCTPSRIPKGKSCAIVHSYMSHHHGMILAALVNALKDEIMPRRFHANPRIQTVEILLQEQSPAGMPLAEPNPPVLAAMRAQTIHISQNPWRVRARAPAPQTHLLSNGRYGLLLTGAGAGYSWWKDLALTRWTADSSCEASGSWIYIKDLDRRQVFSPTHQPLAAPGGDPQVLFFPYKAEYYRREAGLTFKLEVAVAPGDDVEIRHLTITNNTDSVRRLMIASYGEAVLAPQEADRRHPAFNKLFIESEFLEDLNALLLRRRPRSERENPAFLLHMLVTRPGARFTLLRESDRMRFLGRNRTVRDPAFLDGEEPPAPSADGATLDPVFALGRDLRLGPRAASRSSFVTIAGESRSEVIALARRYSSPAHLDQAIGQARYDLENEMRDSAATTADLQNAGRLLSALLYPRGRFRASARVLAANRKGQTGLWGFGISGDLPILLVRVKSEDETAIVREVLRAHAWWRKRGVKVDLVLLAEKETGYAQELQGKIYHLVAGMDSGSWINQSGGIFLLASDQMTPEDRALLYAAARVILDGSRGNLAAQLGEPQGDPIRLPAFQPAPVTAAEEPTPPIERPDDWQFDNGLGGFTRDGREYQIFLREGESTPRPWINVIANPCFGFLASESGFGCTWSENASENRLTHWSNDPVGDEPGEACYLRDEETAAVWSPTPQPAPGGGPYLIRHGSGYSIFLHQSHGLRQETRAFAVPDAPIKLIALKLRNLWDRPRRLTATYYARWVLGTHPEMTAQYVIPEYEPGVNAILAANPYNTEFAARCAFLASSQHPHGLTADRTEFLGRFGGLRAPAALGRIGLAGAVRAGLDPCAAIMVHIELPPGGERECFFLLGQGENRSKAVRLARKYGDPRRLEEFWRSTVDRWEDLLGAVQVETPDPAMDRLLNRWLIYQTLSSRVWGRSALYQPGGGYGFRDQLQDVTALVYASPETARAHLLEAARRQFAQGDVLHWWHPPSGRGVRTRISDDLLWLPYAVSRYVEITGDETVLDERAPFLEGEPLKPDEGERYASFETSVEEHPLREHCRRAIERGSTSGRHGLPLIGGGDWNDGFNRVGAGGKGESVWLGWFLLEVLTRFAELSERAGRGEEARLWRQRTEDLRRAVENCAWDGRWYRRAFFDNGEPIGAEGDSEWRIDSIPQSWAVLTGAADPERATRAMDSLLEHLVRRDAGLILLADPPFDATQHDPGYIKGYPPGVRENGGMYVHAAVWAAWAALRLGRAEQGHTLFGMINPILRADTPQKAARYEVEPYAVAADISNQPGHAGRGGWTWYTGSAGWLYRLGLEGILGLQRSGGILKLEPCIPKAWGGYSVRYRFGRTILRLEVRNPEGVSCGVRSVSFDGQIMMTKEIPLINDGKEHRAEVVMG